LTYHNDVKVQVPYLGLPCGVVYVPNDFDRAFACDGRTDRRTDTWLWRRVYRATVASGKNIFYTFLSI